MIISYQGAIIYGVWGSGGNMYFTSTYLQHESRRRPRSPGNPWNTNFETKIIKQNCNLKT